MSYGGLLVLQDHLVGLGGGVDGHVCGPDAKRGGDRPRVGLSRPPSLLSGGQHLPPLHGSSRWLFQANQVV